MTESWREELATAAKWAAGMSIVISAAIVVLMLAIQGVIYAHCVSLRPTLETRPAVFECFVKYEGQWVPKDTYNRILWRKY